MPEPAGEQRKADEAGALPDHEAGGAADERGPLPAARSELPTPRGAKTSINTDIYKNPNRVLPA